MNLPGLDLFRNVAPAYKHYPKIVTPVPAACADGVYLKWYTVNVPDRAYAAAEIAHAQQFMLGEIARGSLALKHEVGFVVQHRVSSADFYYVCSWVDNNELWETHYYRPFGADSAFTVGRHDTKFPTFCVWVLGVVHHETQAWTRYLDSARDAPAQAAYCADQYSGVVR